MCEKTLDLGAEISSQRGVEHGCAPVGEVEGLLHAVAVVDVDVHVQHPAASQVLTRK